MLACNTSGLSKDLSPATERKHSLSFIGDPHSKKKKSTTSLRSKDAREVFTYTLRFSVTQFFCILILADGDTISTRLKFISL